MPDNCENCKVSARVDALENEFDRYRDGSSKTHQEMFDRMRSLETSNAVQDANYAVISNKLDELTLMVKELTCKPGKRWEGLIDKAIWSVAAAVIAFLLAKVGL